MKPVDVAIVGAGPAGAWAARQLARSGARVLVFDPSHPREKPCGGGLTGRAIAIVGDELIHAGVPAVAVSTARFESPLLAAIKATGKLPAANDASHPCLDATVPLPADGLSSASSLVIVSRLRLDAALLDAAVRAGARFEPQRVVDVAVGPGGALVRTRAAEHRADVVVGADGANSLVRRRVTAGFARSQISLATGFYAHGATSSQVVISCLADPPGYVWSFPRHDHLAIGVCAQADVTTVGALRRMVAGWMMATGLAGSSRPPTAYSWPIPSLSFADFEDERPAGPGWMLLGDAAGLVDPLTREGIFFALRSAELAAGALLRGRRIADQYATRLRDEVYPELQRAAALKAGFFSSGFTHLMVEALARSGAVRQIMADLIGGRQSYRGLRRRLLGTFEVGLAWRLLRLEMMGRR